MHSLALAGGRKYLLALSNLENSTRWKARRDIIVASGRLLVASGLSSYVRVQEKTIVKLDSCVGAVRCDREACCGPDCLPAYYLWLVYRGVSSSSNGGMPVLPSLSRTSSHH